MASIANIVGQNIVRERLSRGLTQAEVADAVEVKPLTVYRWENGKAWPTAKNIEALARLFKVHATTFFARKSPPEDPKVRDALLVLSRALGYTFAPPRHRAKA